MRLKGKVVAVLIVLSIVVGAGGTYIGLSLWGDPLSSSNGSSSQKESDEGTISAGDLEKIQKSYEFISEHYIEDMNNTDILEGAIQGMIGTLDDPYSVYMDEETVKQFTESLESSFEGIGAEVSMQNGKVTIVGPFKDSPAENAGLRPNDKILSIDGESIEGLDLYDAVLKIRGEKGSFVTLSIERTGASEQLEVKVERDEIPIETVYADEYEKNGQKIGLLEITSFSESTAKDFQKELSSLEKKELDGLIVDVRGNPGGYLESVEQISQYIIPDNKPFIQIEGRDGERQQSVSTLENKKPYPIVTLIDEGSASASEILAAALNETADYELIGETTFGKGTVQQTVDLGDGSNLKLSMFKWLTPDGNWIHETGVEPTIEVRQPDYFYTNPLTIEDEPLTFDMNNEQVKSAQLMLDGLGFSPGRKDGYFNEQTEKSIVAFQETYDLKATGEIDEATAGKLQEEIISEIRDPANDVQLHTAIELLAN